MSIKNSSDTIGNRTRELPFCVVSTNCATAYSRMHLRFVYGETSFVGSGWNLNPDINQRLNKYSTVQGTGECHMEQCFWTAGPRPCTGPWHQLYRTARSSSGICHFSFLSNSEEKNIRECVEKLGPQMLAWGNYNMLQDFISPVIW